MEDPLFLRVFYFEVSHQIRNWSTQFDYYLDLPSGHMLVYGSIIPANAACCDEDGEQ